MKKKQITISVYQIFIALMVIIAIIVTASIVKKHVPKTNRIATGKASDFNGSGTSDDPYKIESLSGAKDVTAPPLVAYAPDSA